MCAALVGALAALVVASAELEDYCGRTEPSIEALAPAALAGLELAAVGVVTRHGARAPAKRSSCWPGFDPDAIGWTCARPAEKHELDGLRFALSYAGTPSTIGERSGCAAGQLLDEGRSQHRALGRALRAAYVGESAAVGALLPDELPLFGETGLALRSSSLERAIVSGEELVAGLVNASARAFRRDARRAIPWTVGEPDFEFIYPNAKRCPRLSELEAAAATSFARDPEASAFDARTRAALEFAMGGGELATLRGNGALDCLAATSCQSAVDTGAALPANLSGALATDAWAAIQAYEAHLLSHDRAAWSRLAMGALGHQVLQHARSAVEGQLGRPKFALWSAHDTTVMPLMAALGVHDGRWAPYAAHFVFEVWRQSGAPPARAHGATPAPGVAPATKGARVRLLYMGRAITARLPGCADAGALCAYEQLEAALAPWSLPLDEWLAKCEPTQHERAARGVWLRAAAPRDGEGPARARLSAAAMLARAAAVAAVAAAVAVAYARRARSVPYAAARARPGREGDRELEQRLLLAI
ncbi:hypothetical protein KFE25_011050 [Diacronema lutheri]|uniref:Acid phosphatase n=1 Tax=Diacronema lutheri TaxID=2081491 RepID=A0A8J5X3I0_DIALT|nr:hypothetical protein KFE25_011050 [Diacronema lutheri]